MENEGFDSRRAGRLKRGAGIRISLPARRLIAATVALVLVLLALGINAGGNESFGYYAKLAVSEPRLDAVITAERWVGRGWREYEVSAAGQTYSLLYDENVEGGPAVGQPVQVVVDPQDREYAIAVGKPGDWVLGPGEDWFELGAWLIGAVILAVWLSFKLLPEDFQRLTARLFRLGQRSD